MNLVGYMQAVCGVGEVARQVIAALDTAGVVTVPIGLSTPATLDDQPFTYPRISRPIFPVNLICTNADVMPGLAARGVLRDRYSIGWWWWEAQRPTRHVTESFDLVDEVWVGSSFAADALSAVAPVPVTRVTLPIELPAEIKPDLPAFGFGPEEFVFLFIYDYNSVVERKNPLGLIEAFSTAFAPGSGATLVLKCMNSHYNPPAHALISDAVARHPHVRLMDGYLTAASKNSLIASCDCYVSTSLRGLWSDAGRGHVVGQACHSHVLFGESRLHVVREQLPC